MSDEVIDLLSDEETMDITTPSPLPPPASPDDMPTAPKSEKPLSTLPSTEEHQPAYLPITPLKMPSLFGEEDSRDGTPLSQILTAESIAVAAKRKLLEDLDEESDDELRDLKREALLSQRDPAKSCANRTLLTGMPTTSQTVSTLPPGPSNINIAPVARATPSRPANVGPSAAAVVEVDVNAPVEVDPALLEEEGDYYINPSLYQGEGLELPQAQEIDTQKMRQLLELNKKSSDATQEMDTPVEMDSLLMKHQKQALFWMVNREAEDNPPGHPRGGILADDQGFGKTISMIALLLTNRPQSDSGDTTTRWGNLIVTPTSVLHQWAAELMEHIGEQFRPRILIYHGPNKPKNLRTLLAYDVVLTTYGILAQEYPKVTEKDGGLVIKRRKPGNLYKIDWFRVVLDEAQAIRNFRRETFKAAVALSARRKWSLSGTPIQNTVNDIYSQFLFLGYHVTKDYKEWETRFKKPLEGKRCTPAHFERFQTILGVVLLRRAKSDKIDNKPVIDLPTRTMTTLDLTFSRTEQQFYESQEDRAVNRMYREAGGGNDFALALNVLLRLRQACGHPALCNWGSGVEFNFSDDELDVVELRMGTKSMFKQLPEAVRDRLLNELGPSKPVPQNCPVCLDVIESGVVTKCGHLFCVSDYESWRRENDSCPSCRAALGSDDDVMSLDGVRKEIHAIARKKKREEEARQAKTEAPLYANISKAEPISLDCQPRKAEPILLESSPKDERSASSSLSLKVEVMTLRSHGAKAEPISLGSQAKAEPSEISVTGKRGPEPSSSEQPSKKQRVPADELPSSDSSDDEDSTEPDQAEGSIENQAKKLKTSTKIKRFMVEYDKILRETDDKVLCFSQWTRMLDLIEKVVKGRGYEYVRLDGRMSTIQRGEQVRLFKTRSKCRLFLISLTAGSTGLNLTVANRVFLMDSWWNPAVENQAIDRVHRIGQKKPVQVIKLKITGSVEERILAIQEKKRIIIDGALGVEGLKTAGRRRLTMRDLMGLFTDVAENVANRAHDNQNDAMASRANEVLDMARDIAGTTGEGMSSTAQMLRYN